MHSSVFLQNARGNNVLSKGHQQLITRYMRNREPPWLLLSDADPIVPGQTSTLNGHAKGYSSMSASMPNANGDVFDTTTAADPTPAEASSQVYPKSKSNGAAEPYINYIRQHLERRQPIRTPMERFGGSGFLDYLQNPLQPLTDNLESITYEVFEKDPVKYDWYERAIAAALQDWKGQRKPASGPDGKVVIAVVGAGRGPLVTRALQASQATGVDVDVWAIEKNPNAFVLLQRNNMGPWKQRVNLVQSDMRSWNGPVYYTPKSRESADASQREQSLEAEYSFENDEDAEDYEDDVSLEATNAYVDIIVSELLGSFADNELSPECLDGIQHVLRPEHGISIPASYTAHLTPIAAPKLHADISTRVFNGDVEATHIPYVVLLHAIDYLSTTSPPSIKATDTSGKAKGKEKEKDASGNNAHPSSKADPVPIIQEAWEFAHPVPRQILDQASEGESSTRNTHNTRFKRLRFPCRTRGVCHGIAGYFEAVLYSWSVPPSASTAQAGPGMDESSATNSRSQRVESKGSRFQLGRDDEPNAMSRNKIELSINPINLEHKCKDMVSWFPIYFPLKNPLYFPDDTELEVTIWRQTDGRKVWYEWMVEAFTASGRGASKRVRLGMSELHSNVKNAYLM